MQPIPQCQYVIRKGEAPDPGRSNILPWSPTLALRPDKWEPYFDPLPPLPVKPGDRPSPVKPIVLPTPEQQAASLRGIAILTAIDHLEPGEFTGAGLPKIETLRTLTGLDVTVAERNEAWAKAQAKKKGSS